MSKSKHSKKIKTDSKTLLYIAWGLFGIVLTFLSLGIGYYFGYQKGEKRVKDEIIVSQSMEKNKKYIENKDIEYKNESINEQLKNVLKKDTLKYVSASHEIDSDSLANPPKLKDEKKLIYNNKPKLAIVIDDVSTNRQVKYIKKLNINLTMSFLPPSSERPNSAKVASKEKFYMVHLPMEAMHFNAEEPYTLRTTDTKQDILKRVTEIKKLFPRVKYINNHTGSKFTSDEKAMNRLIYAFNKNHILFVDSRTTAKTKAPKVLKNLGLKYVSRDVFLDHHSDKDYIKQQIKQAIKVAKRNGHAIAIGHPHKNTLEALYESKDMLKDVDLVQIDKIY